MDDFAPVPAQRTYDNAGSRDQKFAAKKRLVKREASVATISLEKELKVEARGTESEANHNLDVLA